MITSMFIFYLTLLKGIFIKDINYKFINLKELYIKIDKKIILKAKNINIKYKQKTSKDNTKINFHKSEKLLKKLLQYLSFFQNIDISNISINQNKINKIYFENNHLILNSPELEFNGNIYQNKNNFLFKINTLNLKNYKFIIHNIKGNFYSDLIHLYVNINSIYKDAQLDIHLKISNKSIKYHGNIYNVTKNTLSYFKEKLKYIDNINIYNIHFFGNSKYATLTLTNSHIKNKNIKIRIPSINTKINFKNLDNSTQIPIILINYKNLFIKSFDIQSSYKNKSLFFIIPLINLKHKKNDINLISNYITISKHNIKISNKLLINPNNLKITSSKIFTLIDLNKTKIDTKIKNIKIIKNNNLLNLNDNQISFYKNKLDIKNQITFNNKDINISTSKIYTNIDLNKTFIKSNINKIDINNIIANDLNISYKNKKLFTTFDTNTLFSKQLTKLLELLDLHIPVYQKTGENFTKAKINYDFNKSNLDLYLNIKTKNSKLLLAPQNILFINNGNIIVTKTDLNISNSNVDYNKSIVNANYDINTANLNFKSSKMDIKGKFNTLNLTNIASIKDFKEDIFIDLNSPLNIKFKNLYTNIKIDDNLYINIDKLSILYPYNEYLKEYKIYDGYSKITVKDNVFINSHLITNQKIVEKHLKPIKTLDINTSITTKQIHLSNPDLNITISDYNKTLYSVDGFYKNIDLNLSSIIDKPSQNTTTKPHINMTAKNSYIIYHNSKLYSDLLKLDYNSSTKSGTIISIYKDRNFTIHYKDNKFKLYGTNIKSKTLDDIVKISFLQKPLLNLFLVKYRNGSPILGYVNIKKGYIKELKVFNNIIAFINLIPSLITFQPTGFTSNGYTIKDGYIKFIYYNKIIYIKTFTIKGENMSFNGSGYINLKKNKIDMKVDANLILKLIKDVPVLGYILLGKDGGITLSLSVNGDLNNPTIHKHTMSNILNTPIGILKRLMITPIRPFIKEEK